MVIKAVFNNVDVKIQKYIIPKQWSFQKDNEINPNSSDHNIVFLWTLLIHKMSVEVLT